MPAICRSSVQFAPVLAAADRLVFLRWMSHEVAKKHGGFASWMPKPVGHFAGSGLHYNMSLHAIDGSNPNVFRLQVRALIFADC
eukprot:SAG31_NODE_932_length_10913_cov_3.933235_2_plen_84_part_00